MSTKTTRRTVLANAAALPVLAVPTIAAATTSPDPIFVAIAAHRKAAEHRNQTCAAYSAAEQVYFANDRDEQYAAAARAAEEAENEACDRVHDLAADLARTVPTTALGLAAVLTYEQGFKVWGGYDLFAFEATAGDTIAAFHRSLAQAACALAGLPAVRS